MSKVRTLGVLLAGIVIGAAATFATPVFAASATNVVKQLTAYFTSGGKPITIYVDGEKVTITQKDSNGNLVQPFISDGATYLPVKTVAEAFGKTAEWDGPNATVYIGKKPGATQYMTDILPAYQSGKGYKEYSAKKNLDATGKVEKFRLGGIEYSDGFVFSNPMDKREIWAVWNMNGQYDSFTATFCHVDGTGSSSYKDTGIAVYCDGVLRDTIPMSGDMSPKAITISLIGVNQLKLVSTYTLDSSFASTDAYFDGSYGFGNPILK